MSAVMHPRLKQPAGWFAAGVAFRQTLTFLSDGAFKLFAYLCLEAKRQTGRVEATHQQLMTVLGKSKRSIGTYIQELQTQQICKVFPAKNQHGRTMFEISDAYWPYDRGDCSQASTHQQAYVESVRDYFLSFACVSGTFGAADEQIAQHLYERAIPLAVIENAMLLGVCRKYICWLNRQSRQPIQTLHYFEPVIAEVQAQPLPPGYAAYLRKKIQQLIRAVETNQTCPTEAARLA
jgi:hypothetical protein